MIISKPTPEQGEVVLIRITRVMPYGAYCSLQEYNMNAYLPISEIASGWIKNIHERIKEGQRDTAKVIFIDKEKNAVDISLKKVTAKEKKDKINEFNLEKRAEQLLNQALVAVNKVQAVNKAQDLEKVKQKLATKFETYTDVINIALEKEDEIKAILGVELASSLHEIAAKSIKPKIYEVSYRIELRAQNNKGTVDSIKKALGEIEEQGVEVLYEGAPHYKLISTGDTYLKAEEKIKNSQAILAQHSSELEWAIATKVK